MLNYSLTHSDHSLTYLLTYLLNYLYFAAPAEIRARGLAAVEAYNKALSHGKTLVKRLPLMLIGQDRAGKTSLKKSLRGICFDPEEDSTDGIEVDPSFQRVYRDMEDWGTG